MYPQDLDLVTVTDTSFVLTWFTASVPAAGIGGGEIRHLAVPADSVVRFGTAPDKLDRVARGTADVAYHHVEITGLQPGTTYYYRAESDGIAATPRRLPHLDVQALGAIVSRVRSGVAKPAELRAAAEQISIGSSEVASPGVVTTLTPPPGAHILTVALSNDMHIGETQSGLIVDGFPPPFGSLPGQPPYPETMASAMIADVARLGARVLILNGDLTAEAELLDVHAAHGFLEKFAPISSGGRLAGRAVLTSRGNHDRPHTGDDYRTCPPVAGTDHFDCLVESFPLPRQQRYTAHANGIRLMGLDTAMLDAAGGTIEQPQFEAIEHELRSQPTRPTLVFGHHPVTDESAREAIAGQSFVLDRASAHRLERLYSAAPGVFLHHSGHTHRNRRTVSSVAPHVAFLEVAAIKEYPGGFTLVHIHEGGYMANFHKSSAPAAREWSQASSRQMFGLHPSVTLGGIGDRNFTVTRDVTS